MNIHAVPHEIGQTYWVLRFLIPSFLCKCCCLVVPSLRVLPRISSAQMGREAVKIHSRMNGTPLAHLLVPLYTQQSKRILFPFFFSSLLPFSLYFLF